jgi:hypothetical protein
MKLQAPQRLPNGYRIPLSENQVTPSLSFNGSEWQVTPEWMRATDTIRSLIVTLLYEQKDTLFKTSPTIKTLENLFTPWVVIDPQNNISLKCDLPLPESMKDGSGVLELTAIAFIKKEKGSEILPVWALQSYTENTPVVDLEIEELESECREITLIEAEVPLDDSPDTFQLNTDEEYNARKFAAKERVKEARLKAILARRAAEVETSRYFNDFNINDEESTFSEYDISDFSEDETDGEEKPE